MPMALISVSHLWTSSVFPLRDKREPDFCPTVGTLGSNRHLIEKLILLLGQPHELKALGAATDLRCHDVPRTLRQIAVIVTRR